jgi:hypothetical protein
MLIVETIARIFARGEMTYDPWHYGPILARKPGAPQWRSLQRLGAAGSD